MQMQMIARYLFLWCLVFQPNFVRAAKIHGRLTIGGYAAQERFVDDTGGSNANDVLVFSSRLYYRASELGENGAWEWTSDFRDKHDFFDKLDRERLQLTDRNTFQLRQLSLKFAPKSTRTSATAGRFQIPEAGAAAVDGAQLEHRSASGWSTGAFGGLNPKRPDQSFYQFNSDSTILGLASTYQSSAAGWGRNFYLSHALVQESVKSEVDRQYLYHNLVYQWQEMSRIVSLVYLDFVPRTYIQTESLLWQQKWSNFFSSQLSALGIDVIEYSRRQGVRERLVPSPYREGSARLTFSTSPLSKIEVAGLYGKRDADNLSRSEFTLTIESNRIFGKQWDSFVRVGYRPNFVSRDEFLHLYLGYFSRVWESTVDLEYGIEKYNDGTLKHPLIAELSLSNYLSKSLFTTVSIERAADEQVAIWTGFFRLGYRFGNQELPPVRDGSPPRGQL